MNTLINNPYQSVKILAFDMSGDEASLALWVDEKMHSVSLPFGTGSHSQAAQLFLAMEALLKEANISFQDLNVIATPTGPGSFTGIRLGLATAQGLILSTKAIGFAPTTFHNYAFSAWKEKEDFSNSSEIDSYLVTLTTKRDTYYTQAFDKTLGVLSSASINTQAEIEGILATNLHMYPVDQISILSAESLIHLYFHLLKTEQNLPKILRPYYLHNPEFIKQKTWSL